MLLPGGGAKGVGNVGNKKTERSENENGMIFVV